MPTEKIIYIKDIGEIALRTDKRFRRLSIRMAPTKGIWVNVPNGISVEEAIKFAEENKAWIIQAKQKKDARESQQTIFDQDTKFKTKYHELRITQVITKSYSSKLNNGILEVMYPVGMEIINTDLQEFIRKSIIETLRCEAKYYLPKRIEFLAKQHGFKYHSVQIKNTKSRWGSCSHDNKINLSLHLMRLPEDLSDMVILHELCHTVVKNHSSQFWELLASHCPNLTEKKNRIKKHSINII